MNAPSPFDRQRIIDDVLQRHAAGLESLGTAIRRLRLEVTGLDQESFARMCRISTRGLYQLESDRGNPTLGTLDGILRLFGLRMVLGAMRSDIPVASEAIQPATRKRGARPVSRKAQT